MKRETDNEMRILIRGTNWIGDAVMTIPAIRKLRELFPDAELTLLTREATAGIFRDSGIVNDVVTSRSVLEQARSIRRGSFDLAVVFPNSFESALAVRMGGAKRRFGYASQYRSFLLSDPVEVPGWKETRHEVYYYLELVAAVEKSYFGSVSEHTPLDPRIEISVESRDRARAMFNDKGIDLNKRTVALAPGSTNSQAKRWMPEGFAALNDRLQGELGVQVVLLGSSGDKLVAERVSELSSRKPIDLTGETDISLAAAALFEIDLLVSNDMGLAHLAPAVGTETLVIFGPTNPVTTRPFSEKASIVTAAVECAPCMLRECPIDHRCMTRISADDVFERVSSKLSE